MKHELAQSFPSMHVVVQSKDKILSRNVLMVITFITLEGLFILTGNLKRYEEAHNCFEMALAHAEILGKETVHIPNCLNL